MSNHGSVTPLTEPKSETDVTKKRQPPYAVILHNDDVNTMEYVVSVLRRVFGYNMEKCVALMLEAHNKGCVAVWTGALELAELKADQIISCGADPDRHKDGAEPLRVSVEPVD